MVEVGTGTEDVVEAVVGWTIDDEAEGGLEADDEGGGGGGAEDETIAEVVEEATGTVVLILVVVLETPRVLVALGGGFARLASFPPRAAALPIPRPWPGLRSLGDSERSSVHAGPTPSFARQSRPRKRDEKSG